MTRKAATVRPVGEWIGFFKHFTDEQILRPEYAMCQFKAGHYCKLCDAYTKDAQVKHMAAHTRDLEEYRRERAEAAASRASETLALARAERALAKGATPEEAKTAASGLSPTKRAYNKITSLRYKLNHPKGGSWSVAEARAIQSKIDEATLAHQKLQAEGESQVKN